MNGSPVSERLRESLRPEARDALFKPWIERSIPSCFPLIHHINRAHILELEQCRLLSPESVRTLLDGIDAMEWDKEAEIRVDAELEDVYLNYESMLGRYIGPAVVGELHLARSRNDLQATVDRMRARDAALRLLGGALDCRDVLLSRSAEEVDCVMPGYTHLQHAQPITFGFYLAGVEQSLARDCRRVVQALGAINECPMGAGALAGTSFGLDRRHVAAMLGFDAPVAHCLDAVASKDSIIELVVAAQFLASTIGRLAQDFYVMSTFEFGMLDLPDSLAICSSLMPQKKNQAVLEFLKGRPAQTLGALATAFASLRGAPFSHALDSNADSLRWAWDALDELSAMLPVAASVMTLATPRRGRMMDLARANFCTATDLADLLVQQLRLSAHDAHRLTGRAVRRAIDEGVPLTSALMHDVAAQDLGRDVKLAPDAVDEALDPLKSVRRRSGSGGPAPEDVRALLDRARSGIEQDRRVEQAVASRRDDAYARLRARRHPAQDRPPACTE